jgi:hypothetical protein
LDRWLLGVIVLGAALFIDSLTAQRAISYVAGTAGLFALHERLRREFAPVIATITTVLVFAATSLFWSMTRAVSPSAAMTFALVAGMALIATRLTAPRSRIIAWSLVLAIPVATGFMHGEHEWSGVTSRAADSLFSSSHGFLSLTPVAYVGVIGTAFYMRRDRAIATLSLIALSLFLFAVSVTPRANAAPFDHGLTPIVALLAPGLALIVEHARARPLLAAAPLVAAMVFWNYWLMVQYTVGMLPKDEPVSFAAMVRQQADVHTQSPYVYPFAFPANMVFAWREGVPVDRYELLVREPKRPEWTAVMDRGADRFLLDGWGGAGATPSGPVRWTAGRRATLVFPLRPTSSATVRLLTSARVEDPPVNADLAVELNGLEIGRFSAGPQPTEVSFTIANALVGRVLRAGYNRLTIVSYGIHRVNAADPRPLGPLALRSADVPFPVAVYRITITSTS